MPSHTPRATPVLAAVLLSLAATAPTPASATSARVSHARPHAGKWRFLNSYGLTKAASITITHGGRRVEKLRVTPAKGSGCKAKPATISGTYPITKGGNFGDTWHVGTTTTTDGRIPVTIHQSSKKLPGFLYVDFTSPRVGRVEVIVGEQTAVTCNLYFGIKAPKH
jgi:hypothetical protein